MAVDRYVIEAVCRFFARHPASLARVDDNGPGGVAAAQMAVEDFGTDKGINVEIVSADHQNKADVGSQIANKWYDAEVPNKATSDAE